MWPGKQLAVGIFGRHRPCCIELTWAGVVRVRSRDEGEGIVAEAFVEDLKSDVEAVPRKSAPTFKAVHLSFPSGSLREGGSGMTGGAGIVRVQLDDGRAAEEEIVSAINSAMSHRAERKVQVRCTLHVHRCENMWLPWCGGSTIRSSKGERRILSPTFHTHQKKDFF